MESIQCDNVFELCIANEINWTDDEAARVEENRCDVQTLALLGNYLSVFFNRRFSGKVDHEGPLFNLACNFCELLLDSRFITAAHYNVEALSRKLMAHFKTDSIATTRDQSPRTTLRVCILRIKGPRKNGSQKVPVDETHSPDTRSNQLY